DVLDRLAQGEAVRRDEHVIVAALVRVDRDKRAIGESLGVDDRAVDVGEDLEDGADSDVVPVAGDAEAHAAWPFGVLLERLDADQLADLGVTEDSHDELACRHTGRRTTARRKLRFRRLLFAAILFRSSS